MHNRGRRNGEQPTIALRAGASFVSDVATPVLSGDSNCSKLFGGTSKPNFPLTLCMSLQYKDTAAPWSSTGKLAFVDHRPVGAPRCPGGECTNELDVDVVEHEWRIEKIQTSRTPI